MNKNKENGDEIYCFYCGKHLPIGTNVHVKEVNNEIVDIRCDNCHFHFEILEKGLEYIQNMDVLDFMSGRKDDI